MTRAPTDTHAAGDAGWTALDAQLDLLLAAGADTRAARLDAMAQDDPARARALRDWLAAIDASAGFLEPATVSAAASMPEALGPWRALSLAGRGGMGEVYLAQRADGAFERRVAIKLLRRDVRVDARHLADERALLARLDHPHVARLLDGGVAADGRPYLVTEWVDGLALDAWLAVRPRTLDERIAVFLQLCDAVGYAHANLIVHRDLKPGNVFVDTAGRVKLLDFGIARLVDQHGDAALTQDHRLTPAFAAPEQLSGSTITTRTDVYALGALLFLLLTGRTPHALGGASLREVVARVCDEDAPLASQAGGSGAVDAAALRGDLDAIIATALQREPARRYATVDALRRDVVAWQAHQPVSVRAPSWGYRASRFVRRHRLGVAAAGIAITAITAGAVGIWLQGRVAAHERDIARVERDAAQANANRYLALNTFLVRVFRAAEDDEKLTPAEFLARTGALVAQEGPRDPRTRALLLATFADLQSARGDPVASERATSELLATAGDDLTAAQRARAQCQLGSARERLGKLDEAVTAVEQGMRDARELAGTERETYVFCVGTRARLHAALGEHNAAATLLRATWDEFAALPPQASVQRHRAHLAHALGDQATSAGDAATALRWYQEADRATRALGDGDTQESAQSQLGIAGALNSLGRLAESAAAYDRAMPLLRRYAGESSNYAIELTNSANVLNAIGQGATARARLETALAINARLGIADAVTAGHAHLELAKASVQLGELDRAMRELDLAERFFRDGLGNDHPYVWFPPFTRARVHAARGDMPAVQRELGAVVEHFRDDPPMRGRALALLAELELAGGANGAALSDARDALTIASTTMPAGHHGLAWIQAVSAGAMLASGDASMRAQAKSQLDAALPVLRAAFGASHSRVTRAEAWRAQFE